MTCSLILPYWDRQEAADKALRLLEKHYQGMDLEVIVVDDGNKIPFVLPSVNLDVRVIRQPVKMYPTPQSKAWNAGVKAASGDLIAISCIEVLHDEPVLQKLIDRCKEEKDYILAAAWCPEMNEWHCHSSIEYDKLPKGVGASFLGVMHKSLFYLAGGFDEEYHEGAGYEDKDFIRRLLKVGANFKIQDDIVVTHPKTGAIIRWKADGFRRNEQLYNQKWGGLTPVTFLCLKAGKAYDIGYVNTLYDMVSRNLSIGYPGRFVCLTDDPEGLAEGIEVIPLPDDLETWWGKLYMFKRGLFNDGERVVFLDLDTLIVGNIDFLASYKGRFATLQDFYYPNQLGPAIIAWEAGEYVSQIWDEWVKQGKPRNPMGDLWWINTLNSGEFAKQAELLQVLFPTKFCSFKAHCDPLPPKGVSIVCFHGQPKPDNCMTDWVSQVWKIGGGGFAELEAISNTNTEIVLDNVRQACKLDIPWLQITPPHEGNAVIVAGGPSLSSTLKEIKYRHSLGQTIFAVNGAAKWLNEHDITPDYHVLLDARPENVRFLREGKSKYQLLASQCDPLLFTAAKNATLYHMNTAFIDTAIPKDREANLISSGSTVMLAAMALAYVMGYRNIHLYGADSSYSDNHHAYEQKENDDDAVVDVQVNDRKFKSAPWMVKQAQQFQELAQQLADDDTVITVAGDGLLPYIARCMAS